MYICRREATLEELLGDPMMEIVLSHYRTTAEDVRSLLREVKDRRAETTGLATKESLEDAL